MSDKIIAIAKYVKTTYKSNQTLNPFEDLIKILTEIEGYGIYKEDVLRLVIYRFDKFILPGIEEFSTRFIHITEQISVKNCWQFGYYLKLHNWMNNKQDYNFYEYNLEEAILRFYLSQIKFIEYSKLGVDKNFNKLENESI
jgi:hypothetical protein